MAIIHIFDGESGEWSTDTLSQARYGLASVVLDNVAIFAGGINVDTYSNRVDMYSVS